MKLETALLLAASTLLLLAPAADAQRLDEGFDKENHRVTKEWTGAEEAYPGREGTPKTAILIHADGSQGEVIGYVDYDGEAVFGGDIVLYVEHGYAAFHRSHLDKAFGTKSAGRTADNKLWPGALVPYTVDSGVSSTAQGWIADAIAEWESLTEVRFVERTDETDYLYFTADSACKSFVGRTGGQQNIWVNGCWEMGNAIHEIGHAMGLYHEHTRADRDSHVGISWSNIDSQYTSNFNQYTAADGADLGDYDFASIMHYSCWAASTNGHKTITPLVDPTLCNSTIGQRDGLSDGDIEGIGTLYPDIAMVAMDYAGTPGQGDELYLVDATNAQTSALQLLFLANHGCVTDLDFLADALPPRLYAIDCANNYGAGTKLIEIDFFSGRSTIGTLSNGREATSVAFDPNDATKLYAIERTGVGYGGLLFTIDITNGQTTNIGTLWGDRTHATSIDFSEDGTLYAMNNASDGGSGTVLYTIDPATAETTDIGSLHGDRTNATSIRFGPNGTLYAINNGGNGKGGRLFLIDPSDASTRDIARLSGYQTRASALAIFGY